MAALLLNPSISFSPSPSLPFLLNMEVNPQPPPLSLAPWPRISCQSWAADTQLCSKSHTAWTQHMNVSLSLYVGIFVHADLSACTLVCVKVHESANIHI